MGGGPRSKNTQGGYSSDNDDYNEHVTTHSSESDIDMVHVDIIQPAGTSSAAANNDHTKASTTPQYVLVYAKSKVYIHPTTYSRDNQPGWITIVKRGKADYLVSWIPESLLKEEEKDKLVKVEIGNDGKIQQEEVTVEERALDTDASSSSLPAKRLAWSVPLNALYSIIVTPPTLANWYGNVQIHLSESYTSSNPSVNAPSHRLYFHDDESPSTMLMMDRRSAALAGDDSQHSRMPASWGGEDFISALKKYSNVVKSSLQSHLYLINPSQADLEAHSVPLFEDELPNAHAVYNHRQQQQSSSTSNNARNSILHQSLSPQASTSNTEALPSLDNLTFKVLSSFSKLTNQARHTARDFAQPILAHPRSKPILKHLPPAIASLANANAPEYSSWAEKAGVAGYDAARVYLARWARIVAEEGERARRSEMNFTSAGRPSSSGSGGATSSGVSGNFDSDDLGGPFEVLATTYRIARPRSTRVQGNQPIVESEWQAWFDEDGKLLLSASEAKKRIFQRGLSESARKSAWPFLLGVYEWESNKADREKTYASRKKEYERMKDAWFGKKDVTSTEQFIEEHHRIKIDCLRTDRNQPMFSSNAGTPTGLDSGKDMSSISSAQLAASAINTALRGDAGGQPASNYHTQKMVEILLTYNVHETELGYVQGMSDLCSPLYIVLEGDETLVFWSFVNLMEERMKPNFYRDQSGIKHQLSLLQQLMALMDPQLHQHLESTDSLNLFFCFRWILIAFKREFKFEDCLSVWETLWSAPTKNFHLFLAMSILEKHRNIIIRYLKEFDEVLKYINELSQTLEPQPLLCQAEVLFLGFKGLVETTDRRKAERASLKQGAVSSAAGLRQRPAATGSDKDKAKEKDPLIKLVRDEVDAEANVPDLEISDELRELLSE